MENHISLERYLDNIESINSLIKEKEDLIKVYDAELENCTSYITDMPRQESSGNDKLNSITCDKIKVKDEIELKKIELERIRLKIDSSINAMDNIFYQNIITKLYYHKLSIKDLCKIFDYKEAQMNRHIDKAKKSLNVILNDRK